MRELYKNWKTISAAIITAIGVCCFWWLVPTALRKLTHLVSRQTIHTLIFSPDGHTIAAGGGWGTAHDGKPLDGDIWLWDTESGHLKTHIAGLERNIDSLAYSPDGKTLVSRDREGNYLFWDSQTGTPVQSPKVMPPIIPIQDNIRWFASEAQVKLWQQQQKNLETLLGAHTDEGLTSITIAPDGKIVACWGDKGAVQIWDLTTKRLMRRLIKEKALLWDPTVFSPDSRIITIGKQSKAGQMAYELVNVRTSKILKTLNFHNSSVEVLSFAPDAKKLCTAETDYGVIEVWDAKTGKLLRTIHAW